MHAYVHSCGGQKSPFGGILLNASYLIPETGFYSGLPGTFYSTGLLSQFAPESQLPPHGEYGDLRHALLYLEAFLGSRFPFRLFLLHCKHFSDGALFSDLMRVF